MHRRKTHEDKAATRAMRAGGFLQSRHSYASLRAHPGTSHACLYLAGKDCHAAYLAAMVASRGRCGRCGMWTLRLEVHHIAHRTKMERCWCPENLIALCVQCHRGKNGVHMQTRFKDFNAVYGEEKT